MKTRSQTLRRALTTAGLLFAFSAAHAEEVDPQTFASPESAGKALAAAAREDDGKLTAIFGPNTGDLLSSGDPVADRRRRERFVAAYEKKHGWVPAAGDEMILNVGEKDWPFPIPLVDTKDGWRFDTKRGAEEILNRRIGRNELGAIQACLAFVDAEREYFQRAPMGGASQYAQFIASSEGKKNGLHWDVKEGEEPSPLGALFSAARAEGYDPKQGSGEPYHGYVYRVLLEQGDDANGGELDYVVDGKMTRGFALIAWPAKYDASGVMTFLVNQTGVVYEKDLGPDTAELARKIEEFDPDESWDVVSAEARRPPGSSAD